MAKHIDDTDRPVPRRWTLQRQRGQPAAAAASTAAISTLNDPMPAAAVVEPMAKLLVEGCALVGAERARGAVWGRELGAAQPHREASGLAHFDRELDGADGALVADMAAATVVVDGKGVRLERHRRRC